MGLLVSLLAWSAVLMVGVAIGIFFAVFAFSLADTSSIDLAPNGMAYCPADSSTPHPTPCMFRQP